MSGAKQRKRTLSTAQLKMRILAFQLDGTVATPVAAGFDRFNIDSVVDLGAGSYTIIFKKPFERACELMGWSSKTAGIDECQVVAVAADRITVQAAAGGLNTDADLFLTVVGSDARYDIE
jgi:hypothetical protein